MSVSAAIDELKVTRDILLNNAGVLRNEARELLDKEREITEAIRILEAHDARPVVKNWLEEVLTTPGEHFFEITDSGFKRTSSPAFASH